MNNSNLDHWSVLLNAEEENSSVCFRKFIEEDLKLAADKFNRSPVIDCSTLARLLSRKREKETS